MWFACAITACAAWTRRHGCAQKAWRARDPWPAGSTAGRWKSIRSCRDTEEIGYGDSKGRRGEAQLETGEEGGIPPQAELHDLPQGARLHGKARISALFSRSGETA